MLLQSGWSVHVYSLNKASRKRPPRSAAVIALQALRQQQVWREALARARSKLPYAPLFMIKAQQQIERYGVPC